MKRFIRLTFITLALLGILAGTATAANENEYPNGIEGIKAASVPPPGFYYKMYNVFYSADKLTDTEGNDSKTPDGSKVNFDISLFVNAHRFLWVSKKKILGGYYGADMIIPVFNTDLELGPYDDSVFGLGDICIEPFILSWHGPRYDAAFALGGYIPTGKYDKDEPASPGKDMWTGMVTLGATYYFDPEKTWSASILGRYEIHGEKDETEVTPGDDFHFEWGIGKTLAKVWEVGVAGYCQWQMNDDSVSQPPVYGEKDQVFAIGPEVSYFIPPAMLFLNIRSQWEFGAEDRSEGNFTTLTFTKIF